MPLYSIPSRIRPSTIGTSTSRSIVRSIVIGDDRRRRVGAHAAGHRAGVAVIDRLVVLGGFHDVDVLAVDKGEDRAFRALQHFFDDDARAGVADALFCA